MLLHHPTTVGNVWAGGQQDARLLCEKLNTEKDPRIVVPSYLQACIFLVCPKLDYAQSNQLEALLHEEKISRQAISSNPELKKCQHHHHCKHTYTNSAGWSAGMSGIRRSWQKCVQRGKKPRQTSTT